MVACFFLCSHSAGIDIQMVRLVGNQDNLLIIKIIKGHTVFPRQPHIHMKPLRGSKADIDRIAFCILEVIYLIDSDPLAVQHNLVRKEVF